MSTHRLGIDVGGTNTDAVLLENEEVIAKVKTPTTPDVTTGIINALDKVLAESPIPPEDIEYVMLGTTHCTNAIIERKNLCRVVVVRIGAPASLAVKPMTDWPPDLKSVVGNYVYVVEGGYEFDGREISKLNESAIRKIAKEVRGKVESAAITSIFSPVRPEHEYTAKEIFKEVLGEDFPVSLSYEIGSIGLIERENATILNAALVRVAKRAIEAFIQAIRLRGIKGRLYIGQNDGTLMSVERALSYPIFMVASGPANSVRGAAYLSGLSDGVVVDVGGTTTDIGFLNKGFPREAATSVEIGGVRTNFRMPDLISIGLGGGSIVRFVGKDVFVGPESVGYRLTSEALVFGGKTLTATDVAVRLGMAKVGFTEPLTISLEDVKKAGKKIVKMVEDAIDKIKLNPDPVPVIIVGGGSILLPEKLAGASKVIKPKHFEVANAIGAAIAQVSGEVDKVFSLETKSREEVMKEVKKAAKENTIKVGANPETVEIVEIEEIPLAYLPGNAVRVKCKAVGNLKA